MPKPKQKIKEKSDDILTTVESAMGGELSASFDLRGYSKNPDAEPVLEVGGKAIKLKVAEEFPSFHHRARFYGNNGRMKGYQATDDREEPVIYEPADGNKFGIYLTKGSVVIVNSLDGGREYHSDEGGKSQILIDGSWVKADTFTIGAGSSTIVDTKIDCDKNATFRATSIGDSLIVAKRINLNGTVIHNTEVRAETFWGNDAWMRNSSITTDKRMEISKCHVRDVDIRNYSGSIDITTDVTDFFISTPHLQGVVKNIYIRHRLHYGQIGTGEYGRYVVGDDGAMIFTNFIAHPHEILGELQPPVKDGVGPCGFSMPAFQPSQQMQADATKPKPGEAMFDEYLSIAMSSWVPPRIQHSGKVPTHHPAVIELVDDIHRQIFSRMRTLQLVRAFIE